MGRYSSRLGFFRLYCRCVSTTSQARAWEKSPLKFDEQERHLPFPNPWINHNAFEEMATGIDFDVICQNELAQMEPNEI